ncbi:Ribosomal protein S17e [Pseudocohnilembus persalinus]|uniref:Ribosomal protein S17e n=1 Tax=Pseudocohnilembus persalinus TaxID=266149 RepID=A0A0V0QPV8_PSEPJ|nr:Ribosomal protein S17e [Pseudocohnilembus persalinus]|eukprot:KRX04331.1 Ribosomal protein S17e [Pseudocohnilembus persalinus]
MGRVRTKTVKKAAKVLIEKYYQKLTNDFHLNKKILSEVGKVPSKRLRNKIAGFATHLMKRIQKGPVRGISLKVQEEERERRLDFVPEKSAVDITNVTIDHEAELMLAKIGMNTIQGLVKEARVNPQKANRRGPKGAGRKFQGKRRGDRKQEQKQEQPAAQQQQE